MTANDLEQYILQFEYSRNSSLCMTLEVSTVAISVAQVVFRKILTLERFSIAEIILTLQSAKVIIVPHRII